MEYFRRSQLYEAYGSTKAGWVTLLRPEEQLTKLGSIGRECLGSGRIKLLDSEGNEVVDGEVGELYSRTPYAFQGYWKLPEVHGRSRSPGAPTRYWRSAFGSGAERSSARLLLGVNPHATFRLTLRRRGSASMCRQRLPWSGTRNSFSGSFLMQRAPMTGSD